jgi:ABC-type nitrate/sulfonate/bicarbonate transport system substrate-binding protein
MRKSSRVLAVAATAGVAAMLAGLGALAVETPADLAGDRIAAAFAVVPGDYSVLQVADKGDLLIGQDCAGQQWPNLAPGCLVMADGSPARPVRSVTMGFQAGEASTILVRMPAPQIASR